MGTPAVLALKAGMGQYKSPRMEDRYPDIQFSQFAGAEMIAKKHGFTKEDLDAFGYESHQRAIAATQGGKFNAEIVPITVTLADGSTETHDKDEGIRYDVSLDGMRGVKLLQEGGAITAATSSQICDGASGVMVVSEAGLKALGVQPLARIHHMTVTGGDPVIMLEEPLFATERALKRAGMSIDDIDLYEVNEAFAPVPAGLAPPHRRRPRQAERQRRRHRARPPARRLGTKLMTTLLYAMKDRGARYGLQTMCEGGGLANVTIVERL
jgi:acetyl-CoA C-acetyltransferase